VNTIVRQQIDTFEDIFHLKAALWAMVSVNRLMKSKRQKSSTC